MPKKRKLKIVLKQNEKTPAGEQEEEIHKGSPLIEEVVQEVVQDVVQEVSPTEVPKKKVPKKKVPKKKVPKKKVPKKKVPKIVITQEEGSPAEGVQEGPPLIVPEGSPLIVPEGPPLYDYLYPHLDDNMFNVKITKKKEFYDTRFDGQIYDIEKQGNLLCNAQFELSSHQLFVRNFMSFMTPYNSLLLYHGLGSGKTCSAIGIAEEMRDYLKQMGISQRIIVVASPNVQENFKLQLFDERKLKLIDGIWDLRACTGNKFLKEINPMNMRGLAKETVSKQIKRIINNAYIFMGYIELANYIQNKSKIGDGENKAKSKKRLQKIFNNRLIIIDEVHNIRTTETEENDNKRVSADLLKLVKSVENLRLLLLSATPMFNTYKEIIWLLNLMNINDKRPQMELRDVFDANGNFKIDEQGNPVGQELFERRATGYVSFVRGENPYTFPYRIWPAQFAEGKTFKQIEYPRLQLNNKPIIQSLEHVDVYLSEIGEYQQMGYDYILETIKEDSDMKLFEDRETFGYTLLQRPLEALNMVYPHPKLEEEDARPNIKYLVGKSGLKRIMTFTERTNPPTRNKFAYKKGHEHVFSPDNIHKYSGKIASICNSIRNSEGIVLIYSQYIDGGLVPIVLALEEMGFTRYGKPSSLFATPPTSEPFNLATQDIHKDTDKEFMPAKYAMITGDKALSPNNLDDIKALTNSNNTDGHRVKVVLISQAGSEGLDFKNIRQVHIMEPWYNMNRIEQIIGRTCRNCSHMSLDFSKRNVQIFLYGTLLANREFEAADLYLYRLAEKKAIQIGKVSRVLKKSAVDCLLNHEQTNFTESNFPEQVTQKLSTGQEIQYRVGDKPYSSMCDYMDRCEYKCSPDALIKEKDVVMDTYSEPYIVMNMDKIILHIKKLMKNKFFYRKQQLVLELQRAKNYPLIQINAALSQMINDKNEFLVDKYNRMGNLINIGELYLFQPLELSNKRISVYDRSKPVDYKRNKLQFKISDMTERKNTEEKEENDIDDIINQLADNYAKTKRSDWNLHSETDWYKYAGVVIEYMHDNNNFFQQMDAGLLDKIIINHMIDSEKITTIINMLDYLTKENLTEFETKLKSVLSENIINNNNIRGFFWGKDGHQQLYIEQDGAWSEAGQEDYISLTDDIRKYIIKKTNMNNLVGFYVIFKQRASGNREMVFKTKDLLDTTKRGNRCENNKRNEVIKNINEIIHPHKIGTKIGTQTYLCVFLEILLRLNDDAQTNDKRWFLSPIEHIMSGI